MAPTRRSILIVENAEAERRQLANVLTAMGYDVIEAATSDDALREFNQKNPDLAIVEILIPGIGGLAVAKSIKERAPDWAKVIITSKLMQSRSMAGAATGKNKADVFLQKPFEMGELTRRVVDLIGPGQPPPAAGTPEAVPVADAAPAATAARGLTTSGPATGGRGPVTGGGPPPGEKSAPARPVADARPAPDDGARLEIRSKEPAAFESTGEFEPGTLGDLLLQLVDEGFSGVLHVEGDPGIKQIFFVDGSPVYVNSNLRNEALGAMLLDSGVLDEQTLSDAIDEASHTGRKLGHILVSHRLISAEDLTTQLCRQTALKIAQIFSWRSGHYRVDENSRYPENAATFEPTLLTIFRVAFDQFVPVELIEAGFDRDKKAFPVRVPDEKVADRLRRDLDDDDLALLGTADGTKALGALVAESEGPMLALLRRFYTLEQLGMIALGEAKAAEPAQPATAAPVVSMDETSFRRTVNRVASRLDDMTHFELLSVEPDTPADRIEAAFRQRRDEFAPEKLGFDAPVDLVRRAKAIQRRLTEAYQELSDPEARRHYVRKAARESAPDPNDPEAMERKKRLDAEAMYQKGMAAVEKKRLPYAVECFERAAGMDPKTAEYVGRAGYTLHKMLVAREELWQEAMEKIARAVKLDPENLDYRVWLAEIYRQRGDQKTAYKLYRQILELAPNHEEAKRQIHYLGQTLESTKAEDEPPKRTPLSLFGRRK